MNSFRQIVLLKFTSKNKIDMSSLCKVRDELQDIFVNFNSNVDIYSSKLLAFCARIDIFVTYSIHTYKNIFFETIGYMFQTYEFRIRVYKIVYNLADMINIPQSILYRLQETQNIQELSLYIDICTQIKDISAIDLVCSFKTSPLKYNKKIQMSVLYYFQQLYQFQDCSSIFGIFAQYFGTVLIDYDKLDVDIVLSNIQSDFYQSYQGLNFCYHNELRVESNILLHSLNSNSEKVIMLSLKIGLYSECYLIEDDLIQSYLELEKDYRVSRLDLVDLQVAINDYPQFQKLNTIID